MEKPKYVQLAMAEAKDMLQRGYIVDACVIESLIKGIEEAYGENYKPTQRCSLEKPVVFLHDNMHRL